MNYSIQTMSFYTDSTNNPKYSMGSRLSKDTKGVNPNTDSDEKDNYWQGN
jgi:hypothetical protein